LVIYTLRRYPRSEDTREADGGARISAVRGGGIVLISILAEDGTGYQTALPIPAALDLACMLISKIYLARGWKDDA
jgi:hypothetical protein